MVYIIQMCVDTNTWTCITSAFYSFLVLEVYLEQAVWVYLEQAVWEVKVFCSNLFFRKTQVLGRHILNRWLCENISRLPSQMAMISEDATLTYLRR